MTEEAAPYGNAMQENPTQGNTTQGSPTQDSPTDGGKWTGELLGRALLTRFAEDAITPQKGEDTPDALIKRARQILQTLPPENTVEFNKYNSVIPVIVMLRSTAATMEAKLEVITGRLNARLNSTLTAEKFYAYINKQPVYMTGKDFVEAQKIGRDAYFTQDGKEVMQSIYDLIIEVTEYYVELLEAEPTKDNPLTAIKELYTQQQVGSRLILNTWYNVHGHGYYTRKDGRKGLIMTRAEFDRLVEKEGQADLEEIIKNYIGKGDWYKFEKELKEDAEGIHNATWNNLTGQPKELTKWTAVKSLGKIYKQQENLKDLQREFPELLKAIDTRLQADYSIDALKTPVEGWREPYISRRQLYKINFCNQKKRADGYYRRLYKNGVAIATDNWDTKENLYEKLELEACKEETLEAYTQGYPFYGSRRRQLTQDTVELCGFYYFLLGYNYLIDKVAELHNVPVFSKLRIDIQGATNKAQALQYLVELLYDTVKKLPHDNLYRSKLEVLKNHFLIPGIDKLGIPLSNRKKADRIIKNFTAFKDPGVIINLLMDIPVKDSPDRKGWLCIDVEGMT